MAQKLRRTPSSPPPRPAPATHDLHVGAEIMSVLFFDEMRFDPRDPSGRRRRRVRALEGPRRADPVGRAEGGGRDRRRPADPAPARQPPRGPSHAARALGARGHGLARPGAVRGRRAWPGRASCDGDARPRLRLLGDGEVAEGSVWEAAQFAAFNRLDNLCAIVDVNRLGQSGPTMYQHDAEVYEARAAQPSAGKWRSVDGHDVAAIRGASPPRAPTSGKPFAHRRADPQGQGRLVPRGQGRLARQAGEEGRGAARRRSPSWATPTSR